MDDASTRSFFAPPGRLAASLVLGIALFVGLPGTAAWGQDAGAGAFSRLGTGARSIAVGNAVTADVSGDVSPYYNPALTARSSSQRVAASVALLSFDRELQILEFTTPLGPTAGVGFGVIHGGVNGIDGRDVNGARTEELSTDEFGIYLSFGNRFADRLSVGASLKLFQSDLTDRASGVRTFGLDLGATFDATDRWTLGLSVSDLLAKYEWNATAENGLALTDRFPVRVRLGTSYVLLDDRLRINGEIESRFTTGEVVERRPIVTSTGPGTDRSLRSLLLHDLRGRLGASYQLIDILQVRAGVDRLGVDDVSGLRPSAGFDLSQTVGELDVRLAYAVVLEPYVQDAMSLFTVEIFL